METVERTLFTAVFQNDVSKVKDLVVKNCQMNVNWRNPAEGWNFMTALHVASLSGYHSIIELLLNHPRINVNSINVYGETPFFTVCELGDESLVALFLQDPRVHVNMKSHKGQTPAWEASFQGHDKVVKLLLESCREVDWRTPTGPEHWEPNTTPLDVARKEGNQEVVKLLECLAN